MNTADVRAVLARIDFRKSCVDLSWAFDLFPLERSEAGHLLRVVFTRPDIETGEVNLGAGGWHHLPADCNEDDVVKRAFVAVQAILEHELREAFMFEGRRVFDPHAPVAALCSNDTSLRAAILSARASARLQQGRLTWGGRQGPIDPFDPFDRGPR